MKYEIIWHEIAERKYEVDAGSFDEAVEMLKQGWKDGTLGDEGAALFNEYICDETGEKDVEFNGYW